MGELKPIIDAIISDAELLADQIRKSCEERIERMHMSFDEEKKTAKEKFDKELSKETDRLYTLERAQNNQLLKTSLLAAKSEAIKDAMEAAKKQLADMPDKEYCEFMKKLYKKNEMSKDCVVYLSEKDKKRVGSKAFGGARISDECIKATGGFVMSCGKINCDCTLEGLVEERYNEICDSINEIFKEV